MKNIVKEIRNNEFININEENIVLLNKAINKYFNSYKVLYLDMFNRSKIKIENIIIEKEKKLSISDIRKKLKYYLMNVRIDILIIDSLEYMKFPKALSNKEKFHKINKLAKHFMIKIIVISK